MSVSLRKRGLWDFNGASTRVGSVREEALRSAISLDLGENQLSTLQKPFQLTTFSTPLSKRDARARLIAHATPAASSSSSCLPRSGEQDDDGCSAFSDLDALRYVSVAHNLLRSLIGIGAVSDTLTVLVAPHNQIESVKGLERCVHLRYVDLRHNRLVSLVGLPVGPLTPPLAISPSAAQTTWNCEPGCSFECGGTPHKTPIRSIRPTSKVDTSKTMTTSSITTEPIVPPFEPHTVGLVDEGVVLLLSNNRLRGRALSALSAPSWQHHEAETRLAAAVPTWLSFVSYLDLSSNPLEEIADVERVLRAPHLVQLREVNLSYTPFLLNGSLASALLASAANGHLEWPAPPVFTTRVELFPDVSTEAMTEAAVAASGHDGNALSKAETAAAYEEAAQRAKALCRLASAYATALWHPDRSLSAHRTSESTTIPADTPQWPKEPRVVRIVGAAPVVSFMYDTLSAASNTSTSTISAADTPGAPARTAAAAAQRHRDPGSASPLLHTPPPRSATTEPRVGPDSARSAAGRGRRLSGAAESPSSPTGASVPPVVMHTVPRRTQSGSPRSGTRQRSHEDEAATAMAVNQTAEAAQKNGSVLHTSSWSANESDSTVGYMIFKGRQQPQPGPVTPPAVPSPHLLHSSISTVRSRVKTPTSRMPEVDAEPGTVSSIAEEEGSAVSSIDSQPSRPLQQKSLKAESDVAPDDSAPGSPLQVQLSVLIGENQALRRRNAELEARHREHKQLLTQYSIAADMRREELEAVRSSSRAERDASQKSKSEIKRLKDRVSVLEQQLAKAYGTASAARTSGTKSRA